MSKKVTGLSKVSNGAFDVPSTLRQRTINNSTSPLFQHGERVLKGGGASRHHEGRAGWAKTEGTLWLTNQRLIFGAGFGDQRNWPLDHVVDARPDTIMDRAVIEVEFDNQMIEYFEIEPQDQWIDAIHRTKNQIRQAGMRESAKSRPVVGRQAKLQTTPRNYKMLAGVAAAIMLALAGCIFIVSALILFTR